MTDPNVDGLLWNGRPRDSYGTDKIYGVVPATVVEIDDKKGKRHTMGAVRVRFPWLLDEGVPQDLMPWARCVTWASGKDGKGEPCGWVSTPQLGDEVLVGFEDGDIHRPYVLGQLFNPTGAPPTPPPTTPPPTTPPPETTKPPKPCPPPFIHVHFKLGFTQDAFDPKKNGVDLNELQYDVHHDEDSKTEVMASLKDFVRRCIDHPEYRFEIQGHADASGATNPNWDLSRNRAASLLKALIEEAGTQGADKDAFRARFELHWYGELMPVAGPYVPNKTNEYNRRGEVHVTAPKKCDCKRQACPTNTSRKKPDDKYTNSLEKAFPDLR